MQYVSYIFCALFVISHIVTLVLLLQQVITCDENNSMNLDGSQLANKILMENDRKIRGQHVINNIPSSPESGYLISNSKNDIRREIQLVRRIELYLFKSGFYNFGSH